MEADAVLSRNERTAGDMPDVFREIVRQRVAVNQKFPQPLDQLTRGQSITDACIDWETTESLLRETHKALG